MYPVTADFLDKIKAEKRQVSAKAEISYTDPFIDQSINIAVSEKANVSYEQQTADVVDTVPYKWASLDGSWVLDGSYHLAPAPELLSQYQFGWWGSQLSGSDGSFASPYPTLTVTHLARPIHTLTVIGDSARGEYPVDFQIDLYASDNTLLYSKVVTGNTQINWQFVLPSPILDVTKQVLTITKWSHPGRQVKIVEFFTSIQETYLNDDIVSIRLLEEREASQGSLPVGNITANEVTLTLNNESKKFDVDNIQSPLHNLLKPNRKIKLWLGIEAENNYTDKPPTFTRSSVAYLSDGTQVAANTPRFEPGKFGKAVMVEEGTTNLAASMIINPHGCSVTDADFWGNIPVKKYTVSNPNVQNNFGFNSTTQVNLNQSGSKYITISFWANVIVNPGTLQGYIRVHYTDGTEENHSWVYSPASWWNIGGWQRVVGYATLNSTKIPKYIVRWYVFRDYATQGEIDVAGIQLEQKPYAASFIDGTRAAESLTIPTAGVLNPQEGTVEFWVKIEPDYAVRQARAFIFSHGPDSTTNAFDLIFGGNQGTYGRFYFRNYYSGGNYQATWAPSSSLVGWNYIACTWKSGVGMALYVNGQKVVTYSYSDAWTLESVLATGCQSRLTEGWWNSLIDDLRISNRARTDEEILAAYQSGQPLPVDADTTYKLTFNGSIYPVEKVWIPLGTFWSLDWDSPDDTLEATVTARDRMELLRKGTYQSSQVQTNVSLYTLAEQVLQDAGLKTTEYAIDTALQSIVVPYAWFNPVSHREALRIIAEAALAVVYADRDGIIRIQSFNSGLGATATEITEDEYFLPLRNPSQQSQVANQVIVTTSPLKPKDVAEEVYRSNNPISIPAGQTVTVTVNYNQPPVIEAVASLDSPPAGVSIVSATYYGWGAKMSIQNTSGSVANVTLIINGKPLTVQNKETAMAQDNTSITENGVLRYEFPENPLVQTLTQAQNIANTLLASVKDPRRDLEMDWRGNPALLLGDRITVKAQDYHVIRQEIEWAGYLSAKLTGRKAV